jgi:O-antigen/teichoic acid export membrane protein
MSAVNNNLQIKIASATKWSAITEIAAKIVTPLTSMALARILAPEAFGVVATVTMIVSFADMFADAGFQKYLVQHEFKGDDEKYKNTNVAFLTNLGISFFLWAIIAIFCEPIATLVGNKGLGNVITIACIQLPLSSLSSIQMALYRRDFDFKTLFLVRVITIFIPFFVTIPLALSGFSYWALIIGLLCGQLSNAIILTIKSKWKPKWFYSVGILKEMLSFSIWSLIEAISIWLTTWVDAFIIASVLNRYYLGLYQTSTSMVNTLMALITATTLPVLFSTLSRLQNDSKQFNHMYFKIQRLLSILVFPMGVGVFLYSDLATQILLGSQWSEASGVISIWSLTSAITIVFAYPSGEVYRAKGKPKLSFLALVLHLVVLVPVCIISSKYGFWPLVYARSWIRMEFVLVHFIIMKFAMGISVFKTLGNVFPAAISAATMGLIGFYWRQQYDEVVWRFASIILCMAIYFGLLYLFPNMRKEMIGMKRHFHMKHSG